jgi:hypothetical protein
MNFNRFLKKIKENFRVFQENIEFLIFSKSEYEDTKLHQKGISSQSFRFSSHPMNKCFHFSKIFLSFLEKSFIKKISMQILENAVFSKFLL